MKVLLIVDPQVDFCPGGALAVPDGDQIISVVNALMRSGAYDLVVVSRDWHPDGHVSFVESHPGAVLFQQIETQGTTQTLWPTHCRQNSPGASFHPRLELERVDLIISKGTDPAVDSYSAFFDNQRAHETNLRAAIETHAGKIGEPLSHIEISVCGLALDYCVAATARDAAGLGYRTEVLLDASRAVEIQPGDTLRILRDLHQRGVNIRESGLAITEYVRERSNSHTIQL